MAHEVMEVPWQQTRTKPGDNQDKDMDLFAAFARKKLTHTGEKFDAEHSRQASWLSL